MKKLIQICAVLSLLFAFTVISAQAQSSSNSSENRYEAKIPFDFNIGEKTYSAGNYVIKITRLAASGTTLSLEDESGKRLQTVMVSPGGNVSEQAEIVFNRYENQRYLTRIVTSEAGISLGKSSGEKQIARRMREKSSSTQIALAKLN